MFLLSRGPDFRAAGRFIPNLYTMIATFLLTILALHDQHDLGSLPPMPDGPYLRPEKFGEPDLFRQLEYDLPTANTYRTASGAPGHLYWQNRADHVIHVRLDPEVHGVDGTEEITYHNESPDALRYLWMQLDQNRHAPDSRANLSRRGPDLDQPQSIGWLESFAETLAHPGGTTIHHVKDGEGQELPFTIVGSMMRIDLPEPLNSGEVFQFEVKWSHRITPDAIRSRSGYEILDDGTGLYELAQWFPRMCAYTDTRGWQHKDFVGRGEFTLEFGNYELHITVPENHVVAASGVLQNPEEVLTSEQQQRLETSRTSTEPIMVVTEEEAAANRSADAQEERTWVYLAENVRDVAWASSPAFLMDSWGVIVPGTTRTVMCQSYFPEEGEPIWSRWSTQAIAHTIEVYSRYYPYPYPTSLSVNGPVGGMEYPMITFNGPRPEEDDTYPERTKYRLIGVVIHEVGHNWFPMIINSDERQWTWMDEGLNTFVQSIAEAEWSRTYPPRRGDPENIVPFMTSEKQVPIMTNSESIRQFGNNAYAKPCAALNVLRESVLGRELFDFAFREYCHRWAFRRPEPADLFRSLEDASGVDLDWFWRGWFMTTDHVDIAIENVRRFDLANAVGDEMAEARRLDADRGNSAAQRRNDELNVPRRVDQHPMIVDFYEGRDRFMVTPEDERAWASMLERMEDKQRAIFSQDWIFHEITLRNVGGIPMPVPLQLTYADGTTELLPLPVEIWANNEPVVTKVIASPAPIQQIRFDPTRDLADADRDNDVFPREINTGLVTITVPDDQRNPMQADRDERGRRDSLAGVQAIAKALFDGWVPKEGAAPNEAAAALLNQEAVANALDAFGQPFTVELSGEAWTKSSDAPLAYVTSVGFDGKPRTDDDLAWRIELDGTVTPVNAND